MEEHVRNTVAALRVHFPNVCGCDVCTEDVMIYALNRLPARYVSSLEGGAVTEVALSRDDQRATIDVAVMDAFKKIGAAPRCGRTAGGS